MICACPLCRINELYVRYDADARAYLQKRKPPIVNWEKAKAAATLHLPAEWNQTQ